MFLPRCTAPKVTNAAGKLCLQQAAVVPRAVAQTTNPGLVSFVRQFGIFIFEPHFLKMLCAKLSSEIRMKQFR